MGIWIKKCNNNRDFSGGRDILTRQLLGGLARAAKKPPLCPLRETLFVPGLSVHWKLAGFRNGTWKG